MKLSIDIFADGADINEIQEMNSKDFIKGMTTNPTLMRQAGIKDYAQFAKEALSVVTDKPISFEVFSDDISEMRSQAKVISSWGKNVNVKIPITNTRGESTAKIIRDLTQEGIKLNVTAIFTPNQIQEVLPSLAGTTGAYVSIFAGRIADTGIDPVPFIGDTVRLVNELSDIQVIWASPRELLNVVQADAAGCHIITATKDILKKMSLLEKNLTEYSLETVKMFYKDAKDAGYQIMEDYDS
jgi:transaldolase